MIMAKHQAALLWANKEGQRCFDHELYAKTLKKLQNGVFKLIASDRTKIEAKDIEEIN